MEEENFNWVEEYLNIQNGDVVYVVSSVLNQFTQRILPILINKKYIIKRR